MLRGVEGDIVGLDLCLGRMKLPLIEAGRLWVELVCGEEQKVGFGRLEFEMPVRPLNEDAE